MKLTNEQIQEILDGAPEDEWTHYCTRNRHYYKRDGNTDRLSIWFSGTQVWSAAVESKARWLERRERLEEILTLRQEVERLKAQQSEVAARAVEEILNWDHSYIQTEEGKFAYYDDAIESYANQLREQSNV